MKKLILLLSSIPLFTFSQVKYDAQLAYFNLQIAPEVILAAMPDINSQETNDILKQYDRPELRQTFVEYNPYEAYVYDQYYEEIKEALRVRFGITITSFVKKEKASDSTAYGFPKVGTSNFEENIGFYFVKLNVTVGTLEGGPDVPGQVQDKTTLSPTIQLSLVLYNRKGKKIKKAKAKYLSNHFVEGSLEDYLLWDGKSRMRGFKADERVRKTFLSDLLKHGLGKLQEDFYK